MAIAFLARAGAGSVSGNIAQVTIDTRTARLIVVLIADVDATTTLTDSIGLTWTRIAQVGPGSWTSAQMFYCLTDPVAMTSATHTFYASSTAKFPLIIAGAWTANGLITFDESNSAAVAGGGGANPRHTGFVTPSKNSSIIISGAADDWPSTPAYYETSGTFDNSSGAYPDFVYQNASRGDSTNHFGGGLAYKVLSAIAATEATWIGNGAFAVQTSMIIAAFSEGKALIIDPPQAPKTPCDPQSSVGSGGRGAAGCNTGGVGFVSAYAGPFGDVPAHDDPEVGETLTGKAGVELWVELVHGETSADPILRAMVPLGDLNFGGRKPGGLTGAGAIEHAMGNEQGGYEPATINLTFSDVGDRLFRVGVGNREDFEGDELRVKLASDDLRVVT